MTILLLLTFWITSAASFLMGYFLGKDRELARVKENIKEVIKKVTDNSPVGVVNRPSQKDIIKRTDPYQKKLAEGEEEMRKALKDVVVLK